MTRKFKNWIFTGSCPIRRYTMERLAPMDLMEADIEHLEEVLLKTTSMIRGSKIYRKYASMKRKRDRRAYGDYRRRKPSLKIIRTDW